MQWIRDHKVLVAAGVLAVAAVAISVFASRLPRFPGDLSLTLWIQSFDNAAVRSVMAWVSFLSGGWRGAALLFAGAGAVWWWLGRLAGSLVFAGGVISLVESGLKAAVGRSRPGADLVQVIETSEGNSFPSGHALFAVLLLGIIVYFMAARVGRRVLRISGITVLIVLLLLVGVSRVYLGAHWPSDVIGGYLTGGVFLAGLIWSYEKFRRQGKVKADRRDSRQAGR